MVGIIYQPFFWLLATAFAGIFFCGWRLDRAATRLGINRSDETEGPPRTAILAKTALLAFAAIVVSLFLLNKTSFPIALVTLIAGSLYLWNEAYRSRIRPLVAAGMPREEAIALVAIQLLWIAPLALAIALSAWGRYSAP